ncbi:MAG: hypothetical protein K8R25_09615 [Methanosarcinales archaeon]|nr:hypothetical protein [Methanosarcinales archaeon]
MNEQYIEKTDSPKTIEIIENIDTSTIVQVRDILIRLQSDQKHTEAVMDIEDLKTHEKRTLNYKISRTSGLWLIYGYGLIRK